MTNKEVLKLALEALTIADNIALVGAAYTPRSIDLGLQKISSAITAIKEALAQPEQEPVAWAENNGEGNVLWDKESCFSDDPDWLDNPMPLYTTPPQRTWVGLTESEKSACLYDKEGMTLDYEDYAEAIEAKLREKNA